MKRAMLLAFRLTLLFAVRPATAQHMTHLPALAVPQELASIAAAITSVQSGNWHDGATWSSGSIPATGDSVTIATGHLVTLGANATIAGITVNNGGELRYDANASATLQSSANVVINGKLAMKPTNPAIVHTLRFININEANFVGSGMDVLASDVGLWVMGSGVLDIAGSTKTSWTRGRQAASLKAQRKLRLRPLPLAGK